MACQKENSIEAAVDLRNRLINSNKYYFNNLNKSMLTDSSGVYAIFLRDTDRCLYVGQTTNIQTRIYSNHFMGTKRSSCLRRHIIADSENPQVNSDTDVRLWFENNCYCQYIEIIDNIERYHVEGLLGFLLNSKYIGKVNN